jgi:ribulose kinase
MDTRDDIQIHQDHYIGIDVGTGSARACIIDGKGNIVGLASENIGLWQPQQGYYVRTIHERYLAMYMPVCSARYQPA